MNFKRLIALTVVLASLLSMCAFTGTVSADTVATETIAPIDLSLFDGIVYSSKGKDLGKGYFSRSENKDEAGNYVWPESWGDITVTNISGIYPNLSKSTLTKAYTLIQDGYQASKNGVGSTGTIRSLNDGDERGDYYEISYSSLRTDVYNAAGSLPTENNPVLLMSYYMRIPEATANNDRNQIFRIYSINPSTNSYDERGYLTFNYSGTTHNLTLTIEQYAEVLMWGNDTLKIDPDTWYKIEFRCYVTEDDKLAVGVYYNDVQVSYYLQREAGNFGIDKYNMGIWQINFNGKNTKTSPDATHYDDIYYGLYPVSYKPLTEDPNAEPEEPEEPEVKLIELSAEGDVATATLLEGADVENATLVVALYDAQGNFEKLALSSEIVGEGTRTITCNFPTSSTANNYKAFLFDSLASSKPLAQHIEGLLN